jgi:hypothetical protein
VSGLEFSIGAWEGTKARMQMVNYVLFAQSFGIDGREAFL